MPDTRRSLAERAHDFVQHDEACSSWDDSGPGDCDCIAREVLDALAASALPSGGGERGAHLLRISIDDGVAHADLICPEGGCAASSNACGQCGREIGDDEVEPCYDCPREPADCWLASWAEDESLTAYMDDQPLGTFVIDAVWNGESPEVTIVRPTAPSGETGGGRSIVVRFGADDSLPRLVAGEPSSRTQLVRNEDGTYTLQLTQLLAEMRAAGRKPAAEFLVEGFNRFIEEIEGVELPAEAEAALDRFRERWNDYNGGGTVTPADAFARPPASSEGEQGGRAREWWIARKAGYDGPAAWIVVANDGEASKLRDEWPDDIEVVRVREIPAPPSTEGGEDA